MTWEGTEDTQGEDSHVTRGQVSEGRIYKPKNTTDFRQSPEARKRQGRILQVSEEV